MSTTTARLRRACILLAITALLGASGCGSYGDKNSSSSQSKAKSTPAKKSGGNGY